MPAQARSTSGIVLERRGYRSVGGGPGVWRATGHRRAAQRPAGRWSGYFVLDSFPDTVFDITEWIDRDRNPVIVRYAYQVRYCNGLRGGVRWQFRLDYHPLTELTIYVPHSRFLLLSEALPLLEEHVAARVGACSGEVPGVRGRAPNPAGKGHAVVELCW